MTLDDPNPPIRRPFSDRLLYLGAFALALLLCAVVYGIRTRVLAKQERERAQAQEQLAPGPAKSNRTEIQKHDSQPPLQPLTEKPEIETHPQLAYQPNSDPAPQLSPEEQALLDAEKHERDLDMQARSAPTGIHLNQAAASPNPAAAYPATTTPETASSPQPLSASEYKLQNDQDRKAKFVSAKEAPNPADNYLNAQRTLPISPFEIQQGSFIPAVLVEHIVSDLPGDVVAEVRANVFDELTHKYVLIPTGSKLIGQYNSNVSYGQNRVQVIWTRIIFPDTTFLDLGSMPAHAADGASGLHDQVDNHFKKLAATIALSSVLAAGFQISQNRSQNVFTYPSTGQVAAGALGQQSQQVGQQMLERNLNVQPTLKIRPGDSFLVSVNRDIVFAGPYRPLK